MAIGSGVLLPGVAENPTFPILSVLAYTTGLGYRPTCDIIPTQLCSLFTTPFCLIRFFAQTQTIIYIIYNYIFGWMWSCGTWRHHSIIGLLMSYKHRNFVKKTQDRRQHLPKFDSVVVMMPICPYSNKILQSLSVAQTAAQIQWH